jgi:hypothetical protein
MMGNDLFGKEGCIIAPKTSVSFALFFIFRDAGVTGSILLTLVSDLIEKTLWPSHPV